MKNELLCVDIETPALAAASFMRAYGLSFLPVLQNKQIVGILSKDDISEIEEKTVDARQRVEKFMTWPVEVIDVDCDIRKVGQLMLQKKVSTVVIQEDNRPVDVVTTSDFLNYFVKFFSARGFSIRKFFNCLRP